MKKLLTLLLFVGCSHAGPHEMTREAVSPMVDRISNDEITCYLIGTMDSEQTVCRWNSGAFLPNFRVAGEL